jgi:hypothetical protein
LVPLLYRVIFGLEFLFLCGAAGFISARLEFWSSVAYVLALAGVFAAANYVYSVMVPTEAPLMQRAYLIP